MHIDFSIWNVLELVEAYDSGVQPNPVATSNEGEGLHEGNNDSAGEGSSDAEDNVGVDMTNLTGRQKKLFELRLKMVRIP